MSKKPVLFVDEHQEVKHLFSKIDDGVEEYKQKMGFIKKQADTASERLGDIKKNVWESVYEHLKNIGKLPEDFKIDKDGDSNYSYELIDGVLFVQTEEDHEKEMENSGPPEFIRKIFTGIIRPEDFQ